MSQCSGCKIDLGDVVNLGHLHRVYETSAKKCFFLAKNAQVINFPDGFGADQGKPIPGHYIQLPIGLMYLALKQAEKGGSPGLHPLELKPQIALVREVMQDLAQQPPLPGKPRGTLSFPCW